MTKAFGISKEKARRMEALTWYTAKRIDGMMYAALLIFVSLALGIAIGWAIWN